MKKIGLILILIIAFQGLQAQKYMTQNGIITFYSSTPVEDIEAINNQVSAVINADNGEIASALLLKAFSFEKALMQEHFNEKYVESEKYPKSTFKGNIENFARLQLNETPQAVQIIGKLSIHGVTQDVVVEGMLANMNNTMDLKFTFNIEVSDYDIEIPGPVKDKIAKNIQISAHFTMNEM